MGNVPDSTSPDSKYDIENILETALAELKISPELYAQMFADGIIKEFKLGEAREDLEVDS